MIEQHLGVWLWEGPAPGKTTGDYPLLLAFNALGGGAAPLFVTLAGIGTSLLVIKRGRGVDATLLRRGFALIAFGLLLNLITPSWFTWRSWFVLHLMGAGMLAAPLLRRLGARALLCAALAVLLATPAMQIALEVPASLDNPRMAGILREFPDGRRIFTDYALLRVALVEGQFPIFGWSSFFIVGLWAGRRIHEGRWGRVAGVGASAALLGASAAGLGLALHFDPQSYGWWATRIPVPFFPASPALLCLLMAAVLLAVAGVGSWAQRRGALGPHSWMVALGRASLSLLLLHVYLFRELTRPIGWWRGLDASEALAVIVAFTALAFVAAKLWQRVDFRFGAEWLLRKLAP